MGNTVGDAIDWVIDSGAEALAEFGVDEALADAIVETAVEAAVTVAVNVAVSALIAPSIGAEGRPTSPRWSPDAGMPYVMGRRATAGTLAMMDEYGADNRFLSAVRVLSGYGPAQSFGTTFINKGSVSFDGTGNAANGTSYRDRLWLTTQLGLDTEPGHLTQAGLDGGAVMANWGTAHKLSGKVAGIITAKHNSKRDFWTNGFPDWLQVISTGQCYDPRLDSTFAGGSGAHRWGTKSTYAYSVNGAIHALNYALGLHENGYLVEGLGVDIDEVDVASFVECANIADLNGWTCHAAWTSKDDKAEVFKGMLQAAGARPAFRGGKLAAVSIASQKVSVTSITSADTAGPISLKAFGTRLGRKNTITPKCVLESHDWEAVDLDPVSSSAWVAEDDGEARHTSIDYPFVTDPAQARELAAYAVANSREAMALTIPVKPYHLDLDVGDCITIDEPEFNVSGLKVQILERSIDMATGVTVLQVMSETDGKHAFALGLSTTPPTPAGLVESNSYERVDPPAADWNAPVATTVTNPATGGSIPVYVITGEVASPRVQYVRLEYRYRMPDGEGGFGGWSDWSPAQETRADIARFELSGLPPGADVGSRVTYVTDYGGLSDTPLEIDPIQIGSLVAENVASVGARSADAVNTALDDAASQIAGGIAAVKSDAATLQEALSALKDELDPTAADAVEAANNRMADLVQATNDVLAAAELGDSLVNARVQRLEPPSENLIQDAWLQAGGALNWRDHTGAPGTMVPQGGFARIRAAGSFASAGAGPKAIYVPRKPVKAGEVYEVAAGVYSEGVATSLDLRLAIFASESASSPSQILSVPVTSGGRGGSYTLAVPVDGWARFEAEAQVSGAGAAAIDLEAPLWRLADSGQASLSPAPSQDDGSLTFIRSLQAVQTNLATAAARLRAANDHALAEIEEIVIATVEDGGVLTARINTLTSQYSDLSADVTALEQSIIGLVAEASRTDRLEVGAVLNRIDDPLFDRGADAWTWDGNPPLIVTEGGNRLLRLERSAASAGVAGYIEHATPIRVNADQRVEWSPRIRLGGVAASASLACRFTDLAGNDLSTPTGATISGAGWVNGLAFFTPSEDVYVYPRIVLNASSAGLAWVDFEEPQLIGALDGQTARTVFERGRDPVTVQALEQLKAASREAADRARLRYSAAYVEARIDTEASIREQADLIQAQTSAAIDLRLTNAEGSLSTAEGNITTLQSVTTSLAADKVDVTTFNALSASVTGQGTRLTNAEGDISSLQTITTGLESDKAEVTDLDALSLVVTGVQGDVSTNAGAIASASASITSLNSAVAALETDKVSVTAFNALSSTVAAQGTSITTIQGDISSLQTIATDLENSKAEASDLSALTVTVTGQGNDISTLQGSVSNNTVAIADLGANKAEVSVVNAISAKADDNEAAVQEVTTALTDQAGSLAAFRRQVLAGGAGAFMEMGAQDTNGVFSSTFGIGARQVVIYNTIAGAYQQAVIFENGDMTLKGTLISGGGIFYGDGTAKWPVMLEDREYSLADGDVVSFGVDFGNTPDFWFDPLGLDQLASGESYRLRAINATGTGFTLEAKISQQSANQLITEATNATVPPGPDQMIAKVSAFTAFDDVYEFRVDGSVNITHFDEGFGSQWVGQVSIQTYFHDGSAWVAGPLISRTYQELGITPTHTDQSQQSYAFTNHVFQVTYSGTVRQSNTDGVFGASATNGGTVTDLNRLRFTHRTEAGVRTASPNGERCKVIVKPRNVGA